MRIVVIGYATALGIVMLFLFSKTIRDKIGNWLRHSDNRIWLIPLFFTAYHSALMLSAQKWSYDAFLVNAAYFIFPTFLVSLNNYRADGVKLTDLLLVLWMWIFVEFGVVQWTWKPLQFKEIEYALTVFSVIIYALLVIGACRKLELNWNFSVAKKDWVYILAGFLALLAIILPLALNSGFAKPGINEKYLSKDGPIYLIGYFVVILATIGLGEEMVFRGILQNFLTRKFGWVAGLVIASIIFGIAHVNNRVGDFRVPNWTFVFYATIAGFGYGYVYHKTKSLMAPAILHALVDWTWFVFFKGGK